MNSDNCTVQLIQLKLPGKTKTASDSLMLKREATGADLNMKRIKLIQAIIPAHQDLVLLDHQFPLTMVKGSKLG
jgi:hypothetical protein